jgi:hypothetical protein
VAFRISRNVHWPFLGCHEAGKGDTFNHLPALKGSVLRASEISAGTRSELLYGIQTISYCPHQVKAQLLGRISHLTAPNAGVYLRPEAGASAAVGVGGCSGWLDVTKMGFIMNPIAHSA